MGPGTAVQRMSASICEGDHTSRGLRQLYLAVACIVEPAMAPLIDRNLVERANTALLLAILWGALATCVLGALAYDIAYWLDGW